MREGWSEKEETLFLQLFSYQYLKLCTLTIFKNCPPSHSSPFSAGDTFSYPGKLLPVTYVLHSRSGWKMTSWQCLSLRHKKYTGILLMKKKIVYFLNLTKNIRVNFSYLNLAPDLFLDATFLHRSLSYLHLGKLCQKFGRKM